MPQFVVQIRQTSHLVSAVIYDYKSIIYVTYILVFLGDFVHTTQPCVQTVEVPTTCFH